MLDYADKKGTQQMKAYLWIVWCHSMSNVFDYLSSTSVAKGVNINLRFEYKSLRNKVTIPLCLQDS